VAADLWTKPIGLGHKPAFRLQLAWPFEHDNPMSLKRGVKIWFWSVDRFPPKILVQSNPSPVADIPWQIVANGYRHR